MFDRGVYAGGTSSMRPVGTPAGAVAGLELVLMNDGASLRIMRKMCWLVMSSALGF